MLLSRCGPGAVGPVARGRWVGCSTQTPWDRDLGKTRSVLLGEARAEPRLHGNKEQTRESRARGRHVTVFNFKTEISWVLSQENSSYSPSSKEGSVACVFACGRSGGWWEPAAGRDESTQHVPLSVQKKGLSAELFSADPGPWEG